MPLIGWVAAMPPGPRKEALDAFAHEVHVWGSYLLYVLLTAHLIGAAKHQWFDRVPTLERMSFRGKLPS
jgi:cytochrome b561